MCIKVYIHGVREETRERLLCEGKRRGERSRRLRRNKEKQEI